jgi:hypothetical protein
MDSTLPIKRAFMFKLMHAVAQALKKEPKSMDSGKRKFIVSGSLPTGFLCSGMARKK